MSTSPTPNQSDLQLSEFDYYLPPELIAQEPATNRTGSRLLHLDQYSQLHDKQFTDITALLRKGDLLVFNNTQVIKARLTGKKQTGGRVEVLVERILSANTALAHVRSSKAPRPETLLILTNNVQAKVLDRQDNLFVLEFEGNVAQALENHGQMPLPPYINRAANNADEARYQTVYAQHPGAVAAPTAGLHFDEPMLTCLEHMGIQKAFVTLHVGAGTFQPIKTSRILDHKMHSEYYSISASTLQAIEQAKANGNRVIAVGTTSARALESAAALCQQHPNNQYNTNGIQAYTQLFITPGYKFKWVNALLTNFHLPQSTLLLMVSALAGLKPIQAAYAHAIAKQYRFFSYGDAMFIESPQHTQT